MSRARSGGGYVPEPTEYERDGPAPEDPFTDPDEINEVLDLTRQSILNQRKEPDHA
jgi:hypothetical protein